MMNLKGLQVLGKEEQSKVKAGNGQEPVNVTGPLPGTYMVKDSSIT